MRKVALVINVIGRVLHNFVCVRHSAEQVVRDYIDEPTWITVPELVTRSREYIALRLARCEEATSFDDVSGATRVHPVVFSVDERDGKGKAWVQELVWVCERMVCM